MNGGIDKSIFNFVDGLVHDKTQNSIFNYIDDPTVMGFNLVIDFNSSNNPLFYQKSDANSAYRYLVSIGESQRAASLYEFTSRIKDMIFKFPYYFQSLSGMKDIYKMDPTLGLRTKDRVLEIKTLESIDLRVGNMIDKYMNAYFDTTYYREMIPINLRKFDCWIIISEIRNFKSYFNAVQDATGNSSSYSPSAGSIGNATSINSINSMFNSYVYKMEKCEFDFSSSNDWMGEIDQKGSTSFSTNSFKIKVGVIKEMHKMNFGQMTFAADTDTVNYRKSIYGVPDVVGKITLPNIVKIENTVGGKGSWLQSTIDTITSSPAYTAVSSALSTSPSALADQVRSLAISKIQDFVENLVSSNNVFGSDADTIQAFNTSLGNVFGKNSAAAIAQQPPNVFGSATDVPAQVSKTIDKNVFGSSIDKSSLFTAYMGNVFNYRPIASTISNGLVAGAQAAATNNNSVQ